MKINEILNEHKLEEGPLDFARKVGAGIQGFKQGGLAGARAGYTAQGQQQAQTGVNKKVLASALERYNKFAAPITAAGQRVSIQQAQAWFNKFSGMSPTSAPQSTDAVGIQQWLTKEIPAYMAAKSAREATGITKGQTVEKDGQQYKWDGAGWRTAKGTYPSADIAQQLTQLATTSKQTKPVQKQPTQTTTLPQGEAKSPQDVVNRLMKLHPDWVPEITRQLLNKQSVTAG
jgi:hypothetical protein